MEVEVTGLTYKGYGVKPGHVNIEAHYEIPDDQGSFHEPVTIHLPLYFIKDLVQRAVTMWPKCLEPDENIDNYTRIYAEGSEVVK